MDIIKTNIKMTVSVILFGMQVIANAATSEDRVTLHGYGDTAVIRAVENNYTNRYNGTNWNYNYLSLNINAQVDEKTKIVAQIRQGSEIVGDMGAYVNFNATDNLTARAGQMKAPIGIFNEIRDIKFLQLSVLTPLMYQDATGLLPDSFKGVESIYHLDMGTHRLIFDIYGGEPKGSNEYVNQGQVAASTYFYVLVQNIYGGRLTYKTPVGLKFSLSAVQDDLLSVVSGSAFPTKESEDYLPLLLTTTITILISKWNTPDCRNFREQQVKTMARPITDRWVTPLPIRLHPIFAMTMCSMTITR
jgi:hypothetical protein